MYYGNPLKLWRMRRFYAPFIRPGDLCFDVGAHVGNRLLVWSWLGARVVAVEPQELCVRFLRRWYGRAANIQLAPYAVGAAAGTQTLWVSERTPTVTTLSRPWIQLVAADENFAAVHWEGTETVPVTTLDALIQQYGEPVFCKIDIEGYELEALRGLSRPLPALSFEYIPVSLDITLGCFERLGQLGEYEYNWSRGERHQWESPKWLPAAGMVERLTALKPAAGSGDVYRAGWARGACCVFRVAT